MCPVVSGFFPKPSHPKFEVLMGECSWVGGNFISHQSNQPTSISFAYTPGNEGVLFWCVQTEDVVEVEVMGRLEM